MRLTEHAELAAMHDLFRVAPAGSGAEAHEAGGAVALRVAALPQVTEINRIIGLSSLAELERLEPVYAGATAIVSLDPEAQLERELEARGYKPGYPWHKFVHEAEPVEARTELSVETARTPHDFGSTVAGGFGLPDAAAAWMSRLVGRAGWHCLVAYDGEQPVAAGALFATGEAGWCGMGATLPAARGRGGQSAILAARVSLAGEIGLTTLVTETGAPREDGPGPSYRNLLRAGFRLAYERPNYVCQL
jgi:GNAT superfamily N-acetyltransferase